ncbi:MAG: TPM domain-containing protein [Chloroflexota bacterium]
MARRPAPTLGPGLRLLAVVAWTLLALLTLAPVAIAAGPPFGDRPPGAYLVDDADVINKANEAVLNDALAQLNAATGVDVVAYLQVKPASKTNEDAAADAQKLLDQWQVGGDSGNGAVLMIEFDRPRQEAVAALVGGSGLTARVPQEQLDRIVDEAMAPGLLQQSWFSALNTGIVAMGAQFGNPGATPPPAPTPAPTRRPDATPAPQRTPKPVGDNVVPDIGPTPEPGPPWPAPRPGVRVYDYAGLFSDATILDVAGAISDIEARTGAQIVVYTQVKPSAGSSSAAEADARSLMDTWGVGRKGYDDGLVILFDITQLDEKNCHGQVQLYAGPGYRASYLTNEDRQRIFDQAIRPNLANNVCDFDSALLAAMDRIDEVATPERAEALNLARQVDAATGLVLAPLLLIALLAWAGWSWLRYGKDPHVTDDASVLMPAPPPGLTPAAASVIMDGRATRHALTTAMMDLAARGELRFAEAGPDEPGKITIEILTPDESDSRIARNRRTPLGKPEEWALERLQGIADGKGHISSTALLRFGKHEDAFQERLEQHVAEEGWYREPPEKAIDRWSRRAAIVFILGAIGAFLGWRLPSNGLFLLGVAAIVGAIGMFIIARAMPQRTMQGAMVNAWLSAYRRTLAHTLDQSRTMDQVVAAKALPWVETPDQAVVWGQALGLHEEVEDVLARSVEVVNERTGSNVWFPAWYVSAGSGGGRSGMGAGPSGIFSSNALPDFGAMTAALSTIGSSPASSGSSGGGGGGGFGGGGSGGGGGGAGGGF